MLDAAEIRRRFPTLTPYRRRRRTLRSEGGLRASRDDRCGAHPARRNSGGRAALRWNRSSSGANPPAASASRTERGTYTAGQLVICPGAWAPQLLAEFGIPITVERQVLYWFDPRGGTAPFVEHPIFIHEDASGMQAYGFPAIDGPGGGVKVAFFRKGVVCTPETIDRTVRDQEIAEMRDSVGQVVPALDGPCLHSATCMYSNTPDEHFVIARHPDSQNITVACGFSGHGFKFVPIVGEILADLAIDGGTGHPISLFDPSDWLRHDRRQPTARPARHPGRRLLHQRIRLRRRAGTTSSSPTPGSARCASADLALTGQFTQGPGRPRKRTARARPRRTAAARS